MMKQVTQTDMNDIIDEVKIQLLQRIQTGDILTIDLIRLMPYVAEKKGGQTTIKHEITHRFQVIKSNQE